MTRRDLRVVDDPSFKNPTRAEKFGRGDGLSKEGREAERPANFKSVPGTLKKEPML